MDVLLFGGIIGGFIIAVGKEIYNKITNTSENSNENINRDYDNVGATAYFDPTSPFFYMYDDNNK